MDAHDTTFRTRPQRLAWKPVGIILIVAAVIAAGAWWLAHNASQQQPPGGGRFGGARGGGPGGSGGLAMPVGVEMAAPGDINVVLNALGTVTPLRVVTVSAQISGKLHSVNYKEGQMVSAGDLLAEIDARPYQAALAQAEGTLARDQALLANAKIDLERYQTLFKEDSIARQQLDAQASLVRQYQGTLKSDQAQVANAKVNLGYTKITAPVSGRVGLRQIDAGNNVQNGGAIVVITQLAPIDVLFNIAEDDLPAVRAKQRAGATLAIDVYDRGGQNKLASGALAGIDNQIDTATGTVKAKAEFANSDESLFPNQFVNVRMLLDVIRGAIVIPTSALERGAGGLFVYVVQPDKTVAVRNIKTGPTEGERVAVSEGLKAGETVVTSGADRLREGSRITLPEDEPAAAGAARPGAAEGQRRGNRADGEQGQRRHRDGSGAPSDASPAAGSTPAAKPESSRPGSDGKPADGSGRQ